MVGFVNNDKRWGRNTSLFKVPSEPLHGSDLYQAHFFLAKIQGKGIPDLRNEFTAMGNHPDGFTLRDEPLGDINNNMGLAGAGGHLHHHGTKRLKSLLYSVDHIRLIGIKMYCALFRHELFILLL